MNCYSCSKRAIFESERKGRIGKRVWCSGCLAKKLGKYEMAIVPLNGMKKPEETNK